MRFCGRTLTQTTIIMRKSDVNLGRINSFIFILCGLKTRFPLGFLKNLYPPSLSKPAASLAIKKNNNVYTHRKTPASTLKELIILIRFKNTDTGRKWDHYVQPHKNKYVFPRRKLERK